jgi:hypothetical protein
MQKASWITTLILSVLVGWLVFETVSAHQDDGPEEIEIMEQFNPKLGSVWTILIDKKALINADDIWVTWHYQHHIQTLRTDAPTDLGSCVRALTNDDWTKACESMLAYNDIWKEVFELIILRVLELSHIKTHWHLMYDPFLNGTGDWVLDYPRWITHELAKLYVEDNTQFIGKNVLMTMAVEAHIIDRADLHPYHGTFLYH